MILLFLSCNFQNPHHSDMKLKEIYEEIDKEILNEPIYEKEKENRIESLKLRIQRESSPEVKKELTDWLIAEYEAYISDSALYYINKNLENPLVREDKRLETNQLIKKADVAAHAGLFGESAEILSSISRENLDSTNIEQYYSAFCDLYQYQSEYATYSEYGREHERLREIYIDSIRMVASPSSMSYVVYNAGEAVRNRNFNEAEESLFENIAKYKNGDRNFSILASILADLYKQKGDKENYKKYIALSALSDLRGAIKENMAIRALATECYEEGDLERADRYLRQSFADANFYSARMRNAQSSRMLPIIGEAYSTHQKSLNHQLRLFVIFISILAFGFIIISVIALIQVRKIRKINKKTKGMLEEMSLLSRQLSDVNKELSSANQKLQNSNKVQAEYGVLFMEYCSMAISALQHYQQSLKVVAAQGSLPALIKKIDSGTMENKTLSEFYTKFDEAILNLYPSFVEKINALLKPEDRIILKPKENLTTELRVFALIRMGINDPEKIAKFLRCSLTTVYTYRSKMKKKALEPDTFEKDVMEI